MRPATDRRVSNAEDLAGIAGEARRAVEIVDRLVGFAGSGPAQTQPVDLNRLLANLVEFRDREWRFRQFGHALFFRRRPSRCSGRTANWEVFLNLLVHAERYLSDSSEKSIVIRSSVVARRAVVEIGYSGLQRDGGSVCFGI